MVKLKGKIVTKILNRKGNNEVTDYGTGERGDGGHHVTCHHDQCFSASRECPGGDSDKSFLIYSEIVRVSTSQRQAGTNNAEVTRGDNKLVISQQEAASGSNIDIVTRC